MVSCSAGKMAFIKGMILYYLLHTQMDMGEMKAHSVIQKLIIAVVLKWTVLKMVVPSVIQKEVVPCQKIHGIAEDMKVHTRAHL
jgi:hypothetical protein